LAEEMCRLRTTESWKTSASLPRASERMSLTPHLTGHFEVGFPLAVFFWHMS
jgi:hypothetical protein